MKKWYLTLILCLLLAGCTIKDEPVTLPASGARHQARGADQLDSAPARDP